MFYLTSHRYVGPNPDQHLNEDVYVISTTAPRTNMSHQIRTEGWLGTSHDISERAHGAYDSLEAAEAAMRTLDEVREVPGGDEFYQWAHDLLIEDGVVAVWLIGATPVADDETVATIVWELLCDEQELTQYDYEAEVVSCVRGILADDDLTADDSDILRMVECCRDDLDISPETWLTEYGYLSADPDLVRDAGAMIDLADDIGRVLNGEIVGHNSQRRVLRAGGGAQAWLDDLARIHVATAQPARRWTLTTDVIELAEWITTNYEGADK